MFVASEGAPRSLRLAPAPLTPGSLISSDLASTRGLRWGIRARARTAGLKKGRQSKRRVQARGGHHSTVHPKTAGDQSVIVSLELLPA